jgi:hypothetical protein
MLDSELNRTNLYLLDLYENRISDVDFKKWNVLKVLSEECPYLITWDRACIIIEKPSMIYLDRLFLPHADGEAAIKYADGYEVYFYHGISIPDKYRKFHVDNWQAQWILNEQQSPTSRYWHHHEELGIALRMGIGSKKFYEQLADNIDVYWQTNINGHWDKDGHPGWSEIMGYV